MLLRFNELKSYCDQTGWVEIREATDNWWFYGKNELDDDIALEVQVSRAIQNEIPLNLWENILKNQLRITEKEFLSFFSKKLLKVEEATKILKKFGLSNSVKKTRQYVISKELEAVPNGRTLNDKRLGYSIQMSHLVQFIFKNLPGVREIVEQLERQEIAKNNANTENRILESNEFELASKYSVYFYCL